jgi:hypothetical protein
MGRSEAHTETINNADYEMYMLPPMDSHDLLMEVTKMTVPAIGPLIDKLVAGKSGDDLQKLLSQEIPPDFFSKAFSSLATNLDKNVLHKVIKAFESVTVVTTSSGKKGKLKDLFDVHFQGELDAMYKWIAWGMRVQWGKSLSALAGGLGELQGMLGAKESQSQDT